MPERPYTIALAGNPNVGKSTVFNALTGLRQHTGNWTGKTVELASGTLKSKIRKVRVVDLPGSYSMMTLSEEEKIAAGFILEEKPDCVIVVCDATCLERNLNIVFQIRMITENVVVAVNLMDEAEKKGIEIDVEAIERMLGLPVCPLTARSGKGLERLIEKALTINSYRKKKWDLISEHSGGKTLDELYILAAHEIKKQTETIVSEAVRYKDKGKLNRDRKLDKIFVGRKWGIPIMLVLVAIILWITVSVANYPSDFLMKNLFELEKIIRDAFLSSGIPQYLTGIIVDGGLKTLFWVISVMLPPMALFFPMFTLLEDSGYIPRVAFNLDCCFRKACTCGKQSMTTCMGFGCNAVGITGSRIIETKRERLIAILTNCFIPCNGRFPMMITVAGLFFVTSGAFSGFALAGIMTAVVSLSVIMSLIMSGLLSKTFFKGKAEPFILELPPYRRPQIFRVIVRSLYDRTLKILLRAALVAFPAGCVIWVLSNTSVDGKTVLLYLIEFFEPLGRLMGLDGAILVSFLLGFPANEIVFPLIIMCYSQSGVLTDITATQEIKELLLANGWTLITAINSIIFLLNHFPCSTSLLTVRKETGSVKWTFVAFFLPLVTGIVLCVAVNLISGLFI